MIRFGNVAAFWRSFPVRTWVMCSGTSRPIHFQAVWPKS